MSITAGLQWNKTIVMETVLCCQCGVPFGMPSDLKDQLRRDSTQWFYCPNGHKQHYSKSTESKLQEAHDAELRKLRDKIWEAEAKAIESEQLLKKANAKLKRVTNGVCPCCNRSFKDLKRHMETKHPDKKQNPA